MLISVMEKQADKTILEIIATNIKKYRDAQKMTQRELGLALGYDEETAQQRISQYENGVRSPNKSTLQQIARVLGQPHEAFIMDNYEDKMLEMFKRAIERNKTRSA